MWTYKVRRHTLLMVQAALLKTSSSLRFSQPNFVHQTSQNLNTTMKGIYLLMILKLIFAVSATASEHAYSQAVQKMTSDLYLEVAKTSKNENIVISPLSIHTAMAMLHYGAEGNSLKQLRNALGLENLSKDDHLTAVRK